MRLVAQVALVVGGLAAVYVCAGATFAAIAGLRGDVAGLVCAVAVATALAPMQRLAARVAGFVFLGKRAPVLRALARFCRRVRPDYTGTAEAVLLTVQETLGATWLRLRIGPDDCRSVGPVPADPESVPPAGVYVLDFNLPSGLPGRLVVGPTVEGRPLTEGELWFLDAVIATAGAAFVRSALFEERLAGLRSEEDALAETAAHERDLGLVVRDLETALIEIGAAVRIARSASGDARPFTSIQQSLERIERFLAAKTASGRPIEAGRGADLCEIVREALSVLAPQFDLRRQTVAPTAPDSGLLVAMAPVDVDQIVVNLLVNASKYSPPGSTIRISVSREGDQAVLVVSDEGPGFQPDGQVPGLPSEAGFGFGLSNVRHLLARDGGALLVESPGRGAVVSARIRLA